MAPSRAAAEFNSYNSDSEWVIIIVITRLVAPGFSQLTNNDVSSMALSDFQILPLLLSF